MANCFISMKGLGDNIYQRAFVKEYVKTHGDIFLDTPWPEIYSDIENVHFVRPQTNLRTQSKNISLKPTSFWLRKRWVGHPKICYKEDGIIHGMERVFKTVPKSFDLPVYPSPLTGVYAVIRPATIRDEWPAYSRNPMPEYLCECANFLRNVGVKVVSIADLDRSERLVEPSPSADILFHKGELGIKGTLGLIANASLVVSGIGWVVPAAMAYKIPSWFICGGWGVYNAPENLVDGRIMNLDKVRFAVPDNFCRCRDANHNCDKRISRHAEKFADFLGRFTDLVPGKRNGVSS